MADQHEETTQHRAADDGVAVAAHQPVDFKDHEHDPPSEAPEGLTAHERALLADLFAIVEEHAERGGPAGRPPTR